MREQKILTNKKGSHASYTYSKAVNKPIFVKQLHLFLPSLRYVSPIIVYGESECETESLRNL